ncbi:cache domain-containing protein [Agromyces seonyuensis]|uniref:Cache domain-containing protein n=1 Tax=Agromyces seonyuensis TaxID=2662446 RepID=A0A6I4NYC3_9MICO|nr:cache domain-containing protein [Agromyces seonyuensis]MWB99171.1 hypothetical protein [Agromyces seonyuensis]
MYVDVDLPARDLATRIAAVLDPVFAAVDDWAERVGGALARLGDAHLPPTAAELDPLVHDLVAPALQEPDSLVTGAGLVAAPHFLADRPWHLAWWQSAGSGELRRLAVETDPEADAFRDHTALEWWRGPLREGRSHVTGPYVDYLCTDDYTVTITTPVRFAGIMAAVVGADLYVERLERVLLPVMEASGQPATLVNASGRIIASADARLATGALLRRDGFAAARDRAHEASGPVVLDGATTLQACGDTSLLLVIGR